MKEEQIDKLLKIIEENGFATVKYIAKAVYASESTVRRQLTTLERMGLVVRSYGGAELKKDSVNTPIELRLQKNHRQKDIIAKADYDIYLQCAALRYFSRLRCKTCFLPRRVV